MQTAGFIPFQPVPSVRPHAKTNTFLFYISFNCFDFFEAAAARIARKKMAG
jgi:hypothetical protein